GRLHRRAPRGGPALGHHRRHGHQAPSGLRPAAQRHLRAPGLTAAVRVDGAAGQELEPGPAARPARTPGPGAGRALTREPGPAPPGRRGVAPAAGRDRRRRTPAEPRASGLWARVLRLTAQKRPPALSPGPEGARVLPRYAPWIGSGKPLHQSGDPPEKTKEAC